VAVEPLQVAAKAVLFAGMILLLGAGVFTCWIARGALGPEVRRLILAGAWAGAFLSAAGSALDVCDTISRATGGIDPSLIVPYLLETKHGNAVLARLAIVAPLLWLAARTRRRTGAENAVSAGLGIALLLSFSLISHAGAQPGLLPVAADLLHLGGVAAWGGALAYGAWLLPWRPSEAATPSATDAVGRLSAVGGWGVTLILATGVYASLKNLWGPRALTETPYGRALLIKLALVVVVLGVAAVNRWVLIPSLNRRLRGARLGALMKVESLLLLAVLGVTAVLVSQSPPGSPPTLPRPLTVREAAGPWMVHGTLERRDPGRFAIDLDVRDATGAAVPSQVAVDLTLTMVEHEMPPVRTALAEIRPGAYHGTFSLPMTGPWQMLVRTGPYSARIPIQTEDAVFIQPIAPWSVMLPAVALLAAGASFAILGLRRVGGGVPGAWLRVGLGAACLLLGVVLAIRAAR
jgi:putative copper export protein